MAVEGLSEVNLFLKSEKKIYIVAKPYVIRIL